MKRNLQTITVPLSLALLFLVVASPAHAAATAGKSINPPNLQQGLVGWWTFDGKDMVSNVADRSGQGNNGALINFTSTTTVAGKIGQALNFNGTNNAASAPVDLSNTNVVTISYWEKVTSYANNDKLDFEYTPDVNVSTNYGFYIDPNSSAGCGTSGVYCVTIHGNVGNSYGYFTRPSVGVWHHIVAVLDMSKSTNEVDTVYVDEVLQSLTRFNFDNTGNFSNSSLYFQSRGGSTLFHAGSLDDVRLYKRALSATEVQQLYRLGTASHANTTVKPPNLTQGLVAHWTFDGKDMISNAKDVSGQGNNGYLINFTSTTTVAGKIGQALNFNGTNQSVGLPSSSNINSIVNNFTFSTWVKLTGTPGGTSALFGDVLMGWEPRLNGLSGIFLTTSGVYDYSIVSYAFTIGTWYHLTWTMDSSNTVTYYVNGINVGSGGTNASPASAGSQYYIGQWARFSAFFPGVFDDTRVYNRVLSAAEISQLYRLGVSSHANTTVKPPNLTQGLVGHWTFDGKDMISNAKDVSGQGNTGYLSGFTSTTTVPGKIGQALRFNGSSQYVDLGTGTFSIPAGSTGMSLSAWVKVNAFSSYAGILSKVSNTSPFGGWQINTNADVGNKFDFGVNVSGTWTTIINNGTGTTPRSTGVWYHVVGTYDGTTIRLYINGTPDGTAAASGSIQYQNSSASVHIGHNPSNVGASYYFNGTIDDVRLYNRALSATEVQQLYRLGI